MSEREGEEVEAAGPPGDRSQAPDDLVQVVSDFVDDLVVDGPEAAEPD